MDLFCVLQVTNVTSSVLSRSLQKGPLSPSNWLIQLLIFQKKWEYSRKLPGPVKLKTPTSICILGLRGCVSPYLWSELGANGNANVYASTLHYRCDARRHHFSRMTQRAISRSKPPHSTLILRQFKSYPLLVPLERYRSLFLLGFVVIHCTTCRFSYSKFSSKEREAQAGAVISDTQGNILAAAEKESQTYTPRTT